MNILNDSINKYVQCYNEWINKCIQWMKEWLYPINEQMNVKPINERINQ